MRRVCPVQSESGLDCPFLRHTPPLHMAQRSILLRLAAAVYGLAVAITLGPRLGQPASPGQLPGAATAAGIDARDPFLLVVAAVVLPVVAALILAWPARRLADPGAQAWAFRTGSAALFVSLWIALIEQSLFWTAVPTLLAFLAASAARGHRAAFSRRDAILVPVALSLFLALFDLLPRLSFYQHLILSVILVLVVRLALPALRGSLPPALCFAAAPLALVLQSHYNGHHQRHDPWPVLVLTLATPLALRLLVRGTLRTRRWIETAVAWFVYPLAAVMYLSATSLLAAEGKPHADLFENAHHLAPANEMLRGELPYRDIITAHGLLQDGLLDSLIMRTGPVTAGRVLEIRGVISSLNVVAVYALAAAVTGSSHLAILTAFLGAFIGTSGGTFRVLPALITLAFLAAAVRRRDDRLMGVAGAGTVVAALTSLDFGAYTFAALLAGVWRARRGAAVRAAAIGFGAAAAVVSIVLAVFRILNDFLRVTFLEILSLGPVYTLPPSAPPASLQTRRFFPDVTASLLDRDGFLYLVWFACLLSLAVALTVSTRRREWTRRRGIGEALVVVLVWIVVTAVSYAERHHLYFQYVVPVVIVTAAYLLMRTRLSGLRLAGAGMVAVTLIAFQPTHYFVVLSMLRRAEGPMAPGVVEVDRPPRAAGAFYQERDAKVIRTVSDYVSSRLRPDETFFDFTNRGALYFLLDRDVPIRQMEVAFYETPQRQREVIARLASNPKVRLAVVPRPGDPTVMVDGVPNEARAPEVWEYLQARFRPAFEDDGVVIWERID